MISPLFEFCDSVHKIRTQNYKPLLFPFEELDTVIEQISKFVREFYLNITRVYNEGGYEYEDSSQVDQSPIKITNGNSNRGRIKLKIDL